MTQNSRLDEASPAIVAILRGIRPAEAIETVKALVDAGIRIVEVPLNSPDALTSIERVAGSVASEVLVGAGTVLTVSAVDAVAAAGATFIVSPNTDAAVILRALERGLEPMPGVLSPTEAMTAVGAGALHLKLYPAASVGIGHLRALRDVLPPACRVWAVGGVNAGNLGQWTERGAFGVGVGSSLYRPGTTVDDVRRRAEDLVRAWRNR